MTNKERADLFCKEWLEGRQLFTFQTSGSTGAPKIIELRRDQMIASARKTIKALDLKEGMTSLVCLNVDFVAGKMMLVRSLVAGMNMIVVEPSANPFEALEEQKIDFTALVPYQARSVPPGSAAKIIIGGAPITGEHLKDIQRLKASCYATFGMTETITHIALQKLNGDDKQDYFEVLDGVDVTTDDRQCLVISADFLDHTVVTNDVVEMVGSRGFRWLGRYDDVINTGGVKVFPEKIEYTAAGCLSNRFFVTSKPHDKLGQQVVLVIEGIITDDDERKLLEHLKANLSRYEIPKQVLFLDRFVMTPTQKINRPRSLENALPRPSDK